MPHDGSSRRTETGLPAILADISSLYGLHQWARLGASIAAPKG